MESNGSRLSGGNPAQRVSMPRSRHKGIKKGGAQEYTPILILRYTPPTQKYIRPKHDLHTVQIEIHPM